MKIENKYTALKGDELILKYKMRLPEEQIAAPGLLLLLHGVGGNEDNLFNLESTFPKDMAVVSARAPYTLGPGRYAWFHVDFSTGKPVIEAEEAEKSLAVLKLFINQLTERYALDKQKVYMGGFSQGAIMSFSAGLTYPEKLAGIAALSGRILQEIRPFVKLTPELQKLKIFIAHGTDDQTMPLSYALEARTYMDSLGLKSAYHEYPTGHFVDQRTLADLNNWLQE